MDDQNVKNNESQKGKWQVLSVLAMVPFLMILSNTCINVAITDVVNDLGITISMVQAVISLYALVMAVCMLPGTRLADRFGAKKIFFVGTSLYGIGALIVFFAANGMMLLIGFSVVMGIGASVTMPTMLSLLTFAYSGNSRARALAINSAVASVTMAIGPLLGGAIATYLNWRFVFLLEVIVAVVILLRIRNLTKIKLPKPNKNARFDLQGTILFMLSLSSIIVGMLLAKEYGWITARKAFSISSLDFENISITAILLVLGIILGAALIIWLFHARKKGLSMLIDLDLFKSKDYVGALTIRFFNGFAMVGFLFVLPIYLQITSGYTPLETGMSLLPFSLSLFIMALTVTKIVAKLSARIVIFIGACLLVIGGLFMYFIFSSENLISGLDLLPAIMILGAGIGCMMSPSNNIALSSEPRNLATQASGTLTTANSLASSIGTAVTGTLLLSGLRDTLFTRIEKSIPETHGMSQQELGEKLTTLVDQMKTGKAQLPQLTPEEITSAKNALVQSMDISISHIMLVMVGVAAIAALIAIIVLPRKDRD